MKTRDYKNVILKQKKFTKIEIFLWGLGVGQCLFAILILDCMKRVF